MRANLRLNQHMRTANPNARLSRSSGKGTVVKNFVFSWHPFLVTFRACLYSKSAGNSLRTSVLPNGCRAW
jgi:hypothetical protein